MSAETDESAAVMSSYQLPQDLAQQVSFNEAGLVPAIAQDVSSGVVLMMAWMNAEALAATLATRRGTYWSRSRQELWVKGETSGHTQTVRSVHLDCDGDTVLLQVEQRGPACHTGSESCFTDREIMLENSAEGNNL